MKIIYRIKQLFLLFGDIIAFIIGLILALGMRRMHIPDIQSILNHLPTFIWVYIFWIAINYINELYNTERFQTNKKYYTTLIEAAIASFLVGIIYFYVMPSEEITPKTILLLNVVIGYFLSFLWRVSFQKIARAQKLQRRVLFVGYNDEMKDLIAELAAHPEKGYVIAAIIDPNKRIKADEVPCEVFRQAHTVRPLVKTKHCDLVITTNEAKQDAHLLRELYELLFWGIPVLDLTAFYETITGRIPPSIFSESWFLDHLSVHTNPIYEKFRVLVDFLAGIVLCVFLLIAFPFVALGIKFTSPGPIWIKQKRVGKFGKPFTMYKFRSMYALAEDGSADMNGVEFASKSQGKTKKDTRITSFGKFIRKTRLDELPQAINILKGEMSLIGPRPERPELVEELESHMPYYSLRHMIKPGATGWAGIMQGHTGNIEESLKKIEYDLYYIKNRSLTLDISIMLKTINVMLRFRGQ